MPASTSALFIGSQIQVALQMTNFRHPLMRWWRSCLALCWMVGVLMITACASGPELVDHAFSFNVDQDSQNYEILAYRYGNGLMNTTASDSSIKQFGKSRQGTNVNGPMPLGDNLYVKWRNKTTEQVFEKTVALKPLLPRDMTHQRIHFVVAEGEVFVYLIDPIPRPKDWPIVGPSKFQYEKVRQIHP